MMEYGLIGCPLGHSLSPQIHAYFGSYGYKLYEVQENEMEALLRRRDFFGLNVTIPYKQKVIPFCDWVSERVKKTGSANTLWMENGKLCADNTDIPGLMEMLRQASFSVAGRKAVILGSGGTAGTARASLMELGAKEILIISRKGPVDYEMLYQRHGDAEILINTTPVGMWPDTEAVPVNLDRLPGLLGVADVIYRPQKTRLLREAEQKGIPTAGGLWMLVCQAWHSAKIFTGESIPWEKAQSAYRAIKDVLEENQ